MVIVLGIETTCDDTAVAVVADGKTILSNVISSQTNLHQKFGGVFPELAARQHNETLLPILENAIQEADISVDQIDLIAVAKGPGLIGSLMIGMNAAKSLSLAWNKPFVGVNHVEAHLYGAIMSHPSPVFPAIGVVISGGHTFIVRIEAIGKYQLIGATVDDAIGEAFDKVAAMLDLPYPGGPAIEAIAREGDPSRYPFKAGVVKGKPWDFSFSGLKTNVLYTIKGQNCDKLCKIAIPPEQIPHIAASFQEVALMAIVERAISAASKFKCAAIYFGGGVSVNERLREIMSKKKGKDVQVFWPKKGLSLDNAAMIAGLGFHCFQGTGDSLDLEPSPRISFCLHS